MVFALAFLVAVVVVALLALGVAAVVGGRLRAQAAGDRDAAVAAAVAAVTQEARLVLAAERDQTLQSAVDTAVRVSQATLDQTVQAGNREYDHRARTLETQLSQIGASLVELGGVVTQLQKDKATQSGSLLAQLEHVAHTQTQLAQHTDQLRQALANPKQRGQWGERMADDVLAAAGMKEGVQFRRQTAIGGGTIPDFDFLLPNDVRLRMDVKFPIDNYLRVLEAERDADRAQFAKAFVRDVRNRIKELHDRGYIDARDTVDCMLLFIPNEAVYSFLHEADPDVLDVALKHKIILCSPSTLFAVLAVVRQSVEQFQLDRTSDEILRCLAGITDEWGRFTTSLDKTAKQLDTLSRTFNDEVNGTRRRVFEKTLGEINALKDGPAELPLGSGEALVAKKAAGDVRALPFDVGLASGRSLDGDQPASSSRPSA